MKDLYEIDKDITCMPFCFCFLRSRQSLLCCLCINLAMALGCYLLTKVAKQSMIPQVILTLILKDLWVYFPILSTLVLFFFFMTVPETREEPMSSIYLAVPSSTYHSVLQEQTLNKYCQPTRQNSISCPMAYDLLKEILKSLSPHIMKSCQWPLRMKGS